MTVPSAARSTRNTPLVSSELVVEPPCRSTAGRLTVSRLSASPVKIAELPDPKAEPQITPEGLILTNEGGLHCDNPSWRLVEQVLSELDPGNGNSFCCLKVPNSSYVQTLRGFNGYHLEWRVVTGAGIEDYIHYRAGYPGGSTKPMELKKHDHVSPGEHRDLIRWADVVEAFRAFYQGDGLPALFDWRPLDI